MADGSLDGLSASALTAPSFTPRPDCVAGVATNVPMQTVQIGSSIGKINLNPGAVTEVQNYQFGNCQTGALRWFLSMTAVVRIASEGRIHRNCRAAMK